MKTSLRTLATALVVVVVSATTASAGGIAGLGTPGVCPLISTLKLKPAWILGGFATSSSGKIGGKLGTKLTPCSGGVGDGAGVIGGTIKAVFSSTSNDCLNITAGLPAFTATLKWKVSKGAQKLLPTTLMFAATPPGAINLAGPGGSIQMTLTGTGASVDAKGRPASFAGNTFTAVLTTDETLTDFTTACIPPSKGLKGFHFTGVNGPSTLSN